MPAVLGNSAMSFSFSENQRRPTNSATTRAIRPTATSGAVIANVRNLLALMIARTAAALMKDSPTNSSQPRAA
ncbi:hypothetical protein LP419_27235 [Massilia sp. H-1]|nr:hypothetical protein LP419_27235 [Massilia sp. H-1]